MAGPTAGPTAAAGGPPAFSAEGADCHAAGGIRDEDDLRIAEEAGAEAWLTASALHDRRIGPRARKATEEARASG